MRLAGVALPPLSEIAMQRYRLHHNPLGNSLLHGLLGGTLSAAVLMWRGRKEASSAVAPINAPSHWIFGDEALRADRVSARHTLVGGVTHEASAVLWGTLYEWLRLRRMRPTASNAVTDAAAVAALAALVDFKLVPKRLTPGFEHRIGRQGLVWVYISLACGLALGGWLALRDRR
jgi:uncharacterized membrane protein YccF (DUF307 family)